MVRCLVDWVKTTSDANQDEALQYVQKSNQSQNGKPSLIQQRSARKASVVGAPAMDSVEHSDQKNVVEAMGLTSEEDKTLVSTIQAILVNRDA